MEMIVFDVSTSVVMLVADADIASSFSSTTMMSRCCEDHFVRPAKSSLEPDTTGFAIADDCSTV